MPRETELKFADADHDAVRRSLQASAADFQSRVFERNLVLDTPDRSLRASDTLLRLRSAGETSVLTLKRPPEGNVEQGVKVWEEAETLVADFDAMLGVLHGLGYTAAFAYEKVRETWTLECGGGRAVFCLDRLPFGDFVEIEAPDRATILDCARQAGVEGANASTASYHQLNREYRQAAGFAEDENFVFSQEQLLKMASLGIQVP